MFSTYCKCYLETSKVSEKRRNTFYHLNTVATSRTKAKRYFLYCRNIVTTNFTLFEKKEVVRYLVQVFALGVVLKFF